MVKRTTFAVIAAVLFMVSSTGMFAQSNPAAHSLASGSYTFAAWPSTSVAGSAPTSMAFWQQSVGSDPTLATFVTSGDWPCVFNGTSASRFTGIDGSGIQMVNTGSTVTSANCGNGGVGGAQRPGAVGIALNTVGRSNISIAFTGATVSAASTSTPGNVARVFGLRLQYRVGTGGTWTDVMQSGNPVEYLSNASSGHSQSYSGILLPVAAEGQSYVQVRWIYYWQNTADPVSGSSRPTMRLDDITVSSSGAGGTPTKLQIQSISPVSPSRNTGFTVVVRSVDNANVPQNVSTNTTISLSVVTGSGALAGTISGMIPAGSNTVSITGVQYTVAESGVVIRATRTAGDALASGDFGPFTVQLNADHLMTANFPGVGYTNIPFQTFTVSALRNDQTVDPNYTGTVTLTKVSGPGSVVLTSSVAAVNGVATFDNVSVNAPGTYTFQLTAPGLTPVTVGALTVVNAPTMTTDVVPQYVMGRSSTSSAFPVPGFARVTFTGLQPSTMYRFIAGVDTAAAQGTIGPGPGWQINYNQPADSYQFVQSKNLTSTNGYSVFSTNEGETTKTIWLSMLATTNAVFQEGNVVKWRVWLGDQLGRLVNKYELNQTSIVARAGTATTQLTVIADPASTLTERSYVFLYDNTSGAGRPLAIAQVQNDGTFISGSLDNTYRSLDGVKGSWCTFIPNTLATGVRRIEERNDRTGAQTYAITSADGVWDDVSTVNATGGFSNPIYLETPRITISRPTVGDTLCGGSTFPISFVARGVNTVRIEFSTNNGANWELVEEVAASTRTYSWIVPAMPVAETFRIRVTGVERTDISALTPAFAIASPIEVVQQPVSRDMCLGEDHQMIAYSGGSVRRYQWYKDGVALPDGTGPVLSIVNAGFGASGDYRCLLSGYGPCGDVWTGSAHVRVSRSTRIVNQPRNIPVVIGSTATISIEAEVPGNGTFQWRRGELSLVDDGRIVGTSSNTLTIMSVTQEDLGSDYNCVVTGVCGTAVTKNIRLFTTGVYVEFYQDPVGICPGTDAQITAAVYTNPDGQPLLIEWFRNGLPIYDDAKYSGTSTATLTIRNASLSDAGAYTCKASLVADLSQNSSATVTAVASTAPVITVQPRSQDVCIGQTLVLTVTAIVAGDVQYQWFVNTVEIPGATTDRLEITDFSAARAGTYTCRISTACGTVVSDVAVVGTLPATEITQQSPATIDVAVGDPLIISLTATGAGTVQYQWVKDGADIPSAVAPTYSRASVVTDDAGQYWCRVTSECGTLTSDTTTVTTRPVVSVDEEVLAGGIVVSSVRPQPATNSASFALTLPVSADVHVQLADFTGRIIATVMRDRLEAGTNTVMFDVASYASGTYTLIMTIGEVRSVSSVSIVK